MEWGFIWLMLVLKIPVIALLWLVWWASRAPEAAEDEAGDGGSRTHPRPPRPPRRRPRGPHGTEVPLPAPRRIRSARAHAPDTAARHPPEPARDG